MVSFEEFQADLRIALVHLYDPAHHPLLEKIAGLLKVNQRENPETIRALLLEAIEALKPAPKTPPTARSWRTYLVLLYRYVQRLSQEEAAQRLNITARHLRREQTLAVSALAQQLWKQVEAVNSLGTGSTIADEKTIAPEPGEFYTIDQEADDAWLVQVRGDLSAFQKRPGDMIANVSAVIDSVVRLVGPLAARHNVQILAGEVEEGLTATIPTAALRQILVQSSIELLRHLQGGQLEIGARLQDSDRVLLTVNGRLVADLEPIKDTLIRELVGMYDGSLHIEHSQDGVRIEISLPFEKVIVLVVDDNEELVHFYQRFVLGTRYRIAAISEGRLVIEAVETLDPDIIVLDSMLPDVDGWELLSHLRAYPATRSTPIIVCTVVADEELALVLGANKYLAKPVRRSQFLAALDEVALGALK